MKNLTVVSTTAVDSMDLTNVPYNTYRMLFQAQEELKKDLARVNKPMPNKFGSVKGFGNLLRVVGVQHVVRVS